ncbi:hypothetical protein ED562_12635 [Microcystis aeruginosa FACHB-524]|nr:hypothetical protein ED562_12635 [Microcystis aeruginosa FACHB-524]
MPTRKEILKILTIVKKTCLPSRVLGSAGAGSAGAGSAGAGRGEKKGRCQIRIGKMPCNPCYQSNFSSKLIRIIFQFDNAEKSVRLITDN